MLYRVCCLSQLPACGMGRWWGLCPCFPPKHSAYSLVDRLLDTSLTTSPASCVYARSRSGPGPCFFELGINTSRIGGAVNTNVASLLHFVRSIK